MNRGRLGMAATFVAVALIAGCAPKTDDAQPSTTETPVAAPSVPTAVESDATAPAGVAAASTSAQAMVNETAGTITVSAQAEVRVTPDTASFGVTVTTEGRTASAAQKANAKPTNAVIEALKELGVDEKSIQTASSNVYPTDTPTGVAATDGDGEAADAVEEEAAYEATTRLQVTDVKVDDLATLMEAATEAGATGVDGPTYTASDYEDAYEKALTGAVKAARPKAEAVAKAAGVTLGDVVGVSEGYQDTAYRAMGMTDAVATEEDATIEPGQVAVTANVTVSYAIR